MFVFSNLATSIDGKIASKDRGHFLLGTPEDRRMMQILRRQSDVVLFGASTLRTHQRPCVVRASEAKGLKQQPANAVLSSKLEGMDPRWPFFTDPKLRRLLFVGPTARGLGKFEKGSEIIALRKPTARLSTATQVLRALEARGMHRVLVEGGGGVMWDFVRENLIDEYHLTLTPWAIGGSDAPTLIDGEGFTPSSALKLRLKACRRVGDELYLTYARR